MPITLTERAAEHVNNYLRDEPGAKGLRLAVRTTGCSGYMYVVETAESIGDIDTVFESNGIQMVNDNDSLKYLEGHKIDFTR